ncbi:hypothetical protein ['Paenibacillus yunnanensis' Narsing Rao et al. 2020]|nr:hypothetical protein [Paenibacillus tengchongensis]
MEGGYRLLINGASTNEPPFCVCLTVSGDASGIDIRYEDIDQWVSQHN